MKANKKINIILLFILFVMIFSLTSCDKYQEISDAEYPNQVIYMPTAYNGIYYVTAPPLIGDVPTEGKPTNFYIDGTNNKLIIPLGVYRGGISRKGSVPIIIEVNNDTITSLIDDGTLIDIDRLSASEYTVPSSIEINDGKEVAIFPLAIDLNFLKFNTDKKFALAVGIKSSEREVNPQLNTTVVVFDASLLNPPQ